MQDYPKIIMNGVELNQGQAMTVWVALQSFGSEMQEKKNALGKDKHGRFMQKAYLERVREINKICLG